MRSASLSLAISLVAAALLSLAPAATQLFPLGEVDYAQLPLWIYPVVACASIQTALAIYLVQLPHPASMRTAALANTVLAASYAMLLGIALAAAPNHFLLEGIELAEYAESARLSAWCLMMLCVLAALAYACGFAASRSEARHDIQTSKTD